MLKISTHYRRVLKFLETQCDATLWAPTHVIYPTHTQEYKQNLILFVLLGNKIKFSLYSWVGFTLRSVGTTWALKSRVQK